MILAIETSDILCSLAFCDGGKVLVEYNHELAMQHATLVGQLIDNGLTFLAADERSRKYTDDDIQLVAVALGPGSFTGLRIGLSYAQGFCYGRGIPIIGISNHQVLAAQRVEGERPLYTAIDARRDEVYLAEHRIDSDAFTEITEHSIVEKKALPEIIPQGSQLVIHKKMVLDPLVRSALTEKDIILSAQARYSAGILAELGTIAVDKNGPDDLADLEPLYIRPFAGVT